MDTKERNRRIKKVLAKEFGHKNVRVRGHRGTAYGWVDINVIARKPHNGECERPVNWDKPYFECDDCRNKKRETRNKVWEILKGTELYDKLGTYWDDMNSQHKKCSVDVELSDKVEAPKKRNITEIHNGDGYKVHHEGSWTWIYFDEKPKEKVRTKVEGARV